MKIKRENTENVSGFSLKDDIFEFNKGIACQRSKRWHGWQSLNYYLIN